MKLNSKFIIWTIIKSLSFSFMIVLFDYFNESKFNASKFVLAFFAFGFGLIILERIVWRKIKNALKD